MKPHIKISTHTGKWTICYTDNLHLTKPVQRDKADEFCRIRNLKEGRSDYINGQYVKYPERLDCQSVGK